MSSTSQKHRIFVAEPMADKPVTDIAGIGEAYGKKLKEVGFDKAQVVLGQLLVLKKNKELFQMWLKEAAGVDCGRSAQCYQCLSDWCNEFMY